MPRFLPFALFSLLLLAVAGCSSSSGAAGDGGQSGGANTAGGNTAGDTGNAGIDGGGTAGTNTGNNDGGATNEGTNDGGTNPPPCDAPRARDIGTLGLQQVVGGIVDLLYAAQPPGSSDWYLVRQSGYIDVFSGGKVLTEHFLDIAGDVKGSVGTEKGLLGLAFHPDYAKEGLFSGLFYVMLTTATDVDQVREYKRSALKSYKADQASKRDILLLDQSQNNHNGGTVKFGPDDKLYVGTGDGGGTCNDNKPRTPQDVRSPFGKILRLDPSKSAPLNGADGNPFTVGGDARVFHYGLRNPFRWGFDRMTGDMYIGDVGQWDFEEINFAPKGSKGLNFGWPNYEARKDEACPVSVADTKQTPPIFAADRLKDTTPDFKDYKSIIGGVVYRGTALPKLQGMYFFGDYFGTRLGALYQCGNRTSAVTPVNKACDANNLSEACFNAKGNVDDLGQLPAIVEGSDGEMYFVANRSALYKVVPN